MQLNSLFSLPAAASRLFCAPNDLSFCLSLSPPPPLDTHTKKNLPFLRYFSSSFCLYYCFSVTPSPSNLLLTHKVTAYNLLYHIFIEMDGEDSREMQRINREMQPFLTFSFTLSSINTLCQGDVKLIKKNR